MSMASNQLFSRLPSAQEYNGRTNSILGRPLQPSYPQVNIAVWKSIRQQGARHGKLMKFEKKNYKKEPKKPNTNSDSTVALTQSQRIKSKFNYPSDTFESPLSKQVWPGLAQKAQNLQTIYAPGQVSRVPIMRSQNYQIPIQMQLNDSNQSGRRPYLYNQPQQSQKVPNQNQMNYMTVLQHNPQQNNQFPQYSQQNLPLTTQQHSQPPQQNQQHSQPPQQNQQHSQLTQQNQQHSQPPQQNQQHSQHNQQNNNHNQPNVATSQQFLPNNYYNMRLRNISKPQSPQQVNQIVNQFDNGTLPKLDEKYMEQYQSKKQFQVPVEKRKQNLDQKQSYLTYELRVGDGIVEMDNLSRIQDPDSSQFMQQLDEPLCNIIIVEQMMETEVPMSLEKLPQELLVSDIIQIALKISSKRLKRPMAWVQLGKATKQQMSSLMSVKELRETYSPPIQIIIEDLNVR